MNIFLVLGFGDSYRNQIQKIVREHGGICPLILVEQIIDKDLEAFVVTPELVEEEYLHVYKGYVALKIDFHGDKELLDFYKEAVRSSSSKEWTNFESYVRRQYRTLPVLILKDLNGELRAGLLTIN